MVVASVSLASAQRRPLTRHDAAARRSSAAAHAAGPAAECAGPMADFGRARDLYRSPDDLTLSAPQPLSGAGRFTPGVYFPGV